MDQALERLVERETEAIVRLVRTVRGDEPADLVLKGCRLVNTVTREIYETDVAIAGGRVATLRPGIEGGARTIDCHGLFAVPGFIDSHTHIESTLLSPAELARLMVPRGTTSIFMDPHEVAAVAGIRGLRAFRAALQRVPFRAYWQAPSRVPQSPGMETTGGEIGLAELEEMLDWPEVASLGEIDFTKVVHLKEEYLRKIALFKARGRVVNGNSAGLSSDTLNAFYAAGIADEHGCTTPEQAMVRLRYGLSSIQLRQSTTSRDLVNLLPLVQQVESRRLSFCDDDKSARDILENGHMDENVRLAIQHGVDPVTAIQMATLNTAEHFRLDHLLGNINPGRYADVLLLDALDRYPPRYVLVDGRVVAERGEFVGEAEPFAFPPEFLRTVSLPRGFGAATLACRAPAGAAEATVRVMAIREGTLRNQEVLLRLPVRGGMVVPDPGRDVLKICCVERYGTDGGAGVGFIQGFGLTRGAIASSVAHDHHNLVAVGTSDDDLAAALRALESMGGGYVAVAGGEVREALPLPLFGLLSEAPFGEVIEGLTRVTRAARELGSPLAEPFMMLGFVGLPTVPDLGLTDRGLIDVLNHRIVEAVVTGA
jgi:adenine deaminase